MINSFCISKTLNSTPEIVFDAWLDSVKHSEFTGGKAVIDPIEGGKFTAWDGYISGKILLIEENKRLIQRWRTSDFAESDSDSILQITFEPYEKGTRITIYHSNIPEGQEENYKDGWADYYFEPMQEYFK